METNTNTVNLQPGQWLDDRAGYIRGGSVKTDLLVGAVYLLDVIEDYCPQADQTYVYETWVCE